MVKAFIADVIIKFTPSKLKQLFLPETIVDPGKEFARLSYSQEGEDLVLETLLGAKDKGCYIDVGAHHPFRFSNTYRFYKNGWRGINIDAMPGSMELFNKYRAEDINLELGVSSAEQDLTYYRFNEPALNTFSESEAKFKIGRKRYHLIDTIIVKTNSLENILNQYFKSDSKIDFMSIDVEGFEMNVLESNNWNKYLPTVILIESLRNDIESLGQNQVFLFLQSKGYKFVARTLNTYFYKLEVEK